MSVFHDLPLNYLKDNHRCDDPVNILKGVANRIEQYDSFCTADHKVDELEFP